MAPENSSYCVSTVVAAGVAPALRQAGPMHAA
jgi:hypothetical protein